MRALSLALVLVATAILSSACASTRVCTSCADAQALVESVARQNPECTRLTLHCAMAGGTKCCASTLAAKVGQPSDREDLEAIQTGRPVVLDETGALDVTVPIREQEGRFHAACGVTLKSAGMTREQAVTKATAIAAAVDKGLQGCGDCCCQ